MSDPHPNADPWSGNIAGWFDPRPLWGCGFCGTVVEVSDPSAGKCCAPMREWTRRLNAIVALPPPPPEPQDPVRWDRVVRRWEAKHQKT